MWDILIITFGSIALIVYGIRRLYRRLENHYKLNPPPIHCVHENEPFHDRIACQQRQYASAVSAIAFFLILGALAH